LEFANKRRKAAGNKGRPPKPPRFGDEVAYVLKRKREMCEKVWSQYLNKEKITISPGSGNRMPRTTKIKHTNGLRVRLRDWLRERQLKRERTVARNVLEFLIEEGKLKATVKDDEKDFKTALRLVQRYIVRIGWKRGNVRGCTTYKEKEENITKRDRFIAKMLSGEYQKKRKVYMDESYIHNHYALTTDSIYDPEDHRPLPKRKHGGQRYCFIGAILDDDHTVEKGHRTKEQSAQWMPEVYHQFLGGKQNGSKKDTKDYHGMFTHDYFVKWMQKLINALRRRNIEGAVIIMDNATYHKKHGKDHPRKGHKKETLVEAAQKRNIPVNASDTKAVIWENLEPVVRKELNVVEKMAKDAGHEILYSPPHYSDLQPIETVWAIVKGKVGKLYNNETTMKDVNQRLQAAFKNLSTEQVRGCIKKAAKKLKKLNSDIQEADEAKDDDMSDDGDDTDSSDEDYFDAFESENDVYSDEDS